VARVLALTTAPRFDPQTYRGSGELCRFLAAAGRDRFGTHQLVEDPRLADLILFIDSARPDLRDIREHPFYRENVERTFLVHHGDRILPFLPGVYTCSEHGFSGGRTKTGGYLTVIEDERFAYSPIDGDPSYLFSFIGSSITAPVRRSIVRLQHPRCVVQDTGDGRQLKGDLASHCGDGYVDIMRRSSFVLCPRGYGSSSYRLFEALKMGRVPVVLSDAWIAPVGPDWGACAVFVREAEVEQVPHLLERLEGNAAAMGMAARRTWEDWFGPNVVFHRIVEWCLELLAERWVPERLARHAVQSMRARRLIERVAGQYSPLESKGMFEKYFDAFSVTIPKRPR
jgi:Exostosin family